MMRERPRLDRKRVLAEEARRRSGERLLKNIAGELGRDEYLGMPVRIANLIVIPILHRGWIDACERDDDRIPAYPLTA